MELYGWKCMNYAQQKAVLDCLHEYGAELAWTSGCGYDDHGYCFVTYRGKNLTKEIKERLRKLI